MATASQAYAALRNRLNSAGLSIPVRWQNEDADSTGRVPLPDVPEPFIYGEFLVESVEVASKVGVLSLVTSSVCSMPLSLDACRSGATG